MRQDVVDLRDFYTTRLGQVARRMIRRRVRASWPDTAGMRVLGIGYAPPYLRIFRDSAERVMAVMPASQGVLHWPASGPGLVCLAEEEELPFEDATSTASSWCTRSRPANRFAGSCARRGG